MGGFFYFYNMISKICNICKQEKEIVLFDKRKDNNTYRPFCKKCRIEKNKIYREKNKLKINSYQKEYRKENAKKIRNKKIEYYYKKIKPNIKNKIKREKEARNKNPLLRFRRSLRTRCSIAFKCKSWKKEGTEKLLGANFEIAKKHIESTFDNNMNWNNYGKWHIDHIIPLSKAKTKYELIKLCHYKNLQALWARDNLIKGAK